MYKRKHAEKAAFYSPIEIKATPAPISKSPEEREFVVDSGASMHMLSKKDLSPEELETLRRSRIPTVVLTANGGSANNRGSTRKRSRSLPLCDCNYSKIRCKSYRLENSAKNTDTPMSGSAVKTTVDQAGEENCVQNEQFRTSCCSRCVIQFWY